MREEDDCFAEDLRGQLAGSCRLVLFLLSIVLGVLNGLICCVECGLLVLACCQPLSKTSTVFLFDSQATAAI